MNTFFTLTPTARRALCDAALARYCPRPVSDTRIGETVHVPYFTLATIVERVNRFGRDWYKLQATMGKELKTLHKLCGAV